LCASSCAYDITPGGSTYNPTPANAVQAATVAYSAARTACGGIDFINACLIGKNQDGIIVAFRGTLPPSFKDPESFLDWITVDFFAIPRKGGDGVGAVPGLVHSGFYDATMSIITDVIKAIQDLNPDKTLPVYLTGHSLGGAMASLAAWMLSQNAGIGVAKVITFASPKPGDSYFKSAYNLKLTQVRYENYEDIVPLLPPGGAFLHCADTLLRFIPDSDKVLSRLHGAESWGYEPVGSMLFITQARQLISDEPIAKQIWDVVTEIGDDLWHANFESFVDAHSHDCGLGYMTGACPGVCPPAS
jgi:hypothetical protein